VDVDRDAHEIWMSRGDLCGLPLPHPGILHIVKVPAPAPTSARKNAGILPEFWHPTAYSDSKN